MRIAVVGSRWVTDGSLVEQAIDQARQLGWVPTTILTGGARGVDTLAERWAKKNGVPCLVDRPNYSRYQPADRRKAPLARNRRLARACDAVIAIWDQESRGTAHMLHCTRLEGKPTHILVVAIPDSVRRWRIFHRGRRD